jgi:protein TonB
MKPENILQADLLDIIFTNRNKDYGAYQLRKKYDSILLKSFAVTVLFAVSLAVVQHLATTYFKADKSVMPAVPVHEFEILKPAEPEKKKEVTKVLKKAPKQAQVANTIPEIVEDKLANKPVPQIEDLNNKIISNIDKSGVDAANDQVAVPAVEQGNTSQGETKIEAPETPEPAAPLIKAEVMPEFPGGMEAFKKFMLRNLRQPELAEGEKVVVRLQFVVDAEGSIKNINVVQSGGELDREVIRVVGKMPKWKPGVQNGRSVAVYFTLPVTFVGSN